MSIINGESVKMHDLVEIYGQNGSFGVFRVVNITDGLSTKNVRLNHALDIFNDVVVPGDEEITGTISYVLAQIMAAQTEKVNGLPYWQLGVVEDEATYTIDNNYENALTCLQRIAEDENEYYFDFDFTTFPWTLNFKAKNADVLTEFRLSRNIEKCKVTYDDNELCTRLYLETEEGVKIYDDTAAQGKWGGVDKTASIDPEEVPDEAEYVSKYFARYNEPTIQIDIDGMELNRITGETLDRMHLGRVCRVALPNYGVQVNERIVTLSYPDLLRQPMRCTVAMANKKLSISRGFASMNRKIKSNSDDLKKAKYSWSATDQHVTDMGTILHEAGLEIDAHGVWLYAGENAEDYALGATFTTQAAAINAKADAQVVTEQGQRLTSAEANIDGLNAEIQLKADASVVEAQETRLTQAEVDIDGLDAEIQLKASSADVNALGTRMSSAEVDIDGLQGEIVLKASTRDVGALGERVNQVEIDMDAAEAELSLKVSADGVASAINMTPQEVLIQASKINLSGYVTVDSLSATNARITNLTSGVTTADVLSAVGLIGTRLSVAGEYAEWHRANWDVPGSLGTTSFLGYQDISIGHYHVMSESNGVITLGAPTTNASSATFNIADTQFYKDAVQSAEARGRASAYPSVLSFSAVGSNPTKSGSIWKSTVSVEGLDDEDISLWVFSNQEVNVTGLYNNAYGAGQDSVTLSGAWSGATYTATTSTNKTASTTITGVSLNGVAKRGSGTADLTQGVIVKAGNTNVLSTNITVDGTLRYNDGWTAARGKVTLPGAGTGTSFSVKVPSATVGNQDTATFTIANSSSTPSASGYANVSYGGNVVGRVSIGGWYSSGVTAGQNAVVINKGSWSNGSISFKKSVGTASTKSVSLNLTSSGWNTDSSSANFNKTTITAYDGQTSTGATLLVDASNRYNAGVTYGKETYGYVTSVTGWSDSYPFQPSDWTQLDVYVKAATDAGDDYAWTGKLRVDASGAFGAGRDIGKAEGADGVYVDRVTALNGIDYTGDKAYTINLRVYLSNGKSYANKSISVYVSSNGDN